MRRLGLHTGLVFIKRNYTTHTNCAKLWPVILIYAVRPIIPFVIAARISLVYVARGNKRIESQQPNVPPILLDFLNQRLDKNSTELRSSDRSGQQLREGRLSCKYRPKSVSRFDAVGIVSASHSPGSIYSRSFNVPVISSDGISLTVLSQIVLDLYTFCTILNLLICDTLNQLFIILASVL